MRKTLSHISILCVLTLTAISCSKSNPILKVNSDLFADAVNKFAERSIGNSGIYDCGYYYLGKNGDPDSLNESLCAKDLFKLAKYLNEQPEFKGITEEDLKKKETWKYYFNSKKSNSHHKG